MWTFIALHLHQLTDCTAQVNQNTANNCNSNNIARSYTQVRQAFQAKNMLNVKSPDVKLCLTKLYG